MKFKVWIQTAFVFNFKKIKCFVIVLYRRRDATPARRKCLLRLGPGLELIRVE